jgi:hypothetical protein
MMYKKGKGEAVLYTFLAVLSIGVIVGLLAVGGVFKTSNSALTGNAVLTPTQQAQALSDCGSTKQTTVTFNLKNALNTTGNDLFDMTGYLYKVNADKTETNVATISDTTGGTETLDCGATYRFKPVTDGSTVNSRITGTFTSNAKVDADGSVVFTTTAPTLTVGMLGSKHALVQVRAYDEEARGFVYNDASGANNQFSGNNVVFTSTIDNATKTSVVAGASLRETYEIRNVDTISDYNDFGAYVLIGSTVANTFGNYWDKVLSVKFDGVDLVDAKATGGLNANEQKAYSGYDYVFLIPAGKLMDSKTHTLYFEISKSSGATGDNTVAVNLDPRGSYLSVDGYSVKTAGAKDTATNALVYPLFSTSIQVTT